MPGLALPYATLGNVGNAVRAAPWALHYAIRPAPCNQELDAVIGVCKVNDCLLESCGFLAHVTKLHGKS